MIEQQTDPKNSVPNKNKLSALLSIIQIYQQKISAVVPESLKNKFSSFRAKKGIFLPLSIAAGLILLTLIAGLIFGKKSTTTTKLIKVTPSPVPVVTLNPQTNENQPEDILSVTERVLREYKFQIDSIDIYQNRIQPPKINFDIKF